MTAVVESILLYGSETWTFTKELTSRVDGVYTRILRFCLDVSWKDKWTNKRLYNGLPKVSEKIKARRLRTAGHCVRHGFAEDADNASVEVAGSLVLWEPMHGKRSVGGQRTTYVDQLRRDTGLADVNEIRSLMLEHETWRDHTETRYRPWRTV